MCLICEEEDLYFLYLERLEWAQKAARGEGATPDANWLWSALPRPGTPATPRDRKSDDGKPRFICDAPP